MNKLEARALIENTGNYEEEEIEEVIDVLEELEKHLGWEDERRDKRFIVKFHDIYYYIPDEWWSEHVEEFNYWFDDFCNIQYDYVKGDLFDNGIDIDKLLTSRTVGHYEAFNVDMPYIGKDNIVQLAQEFYDEYNYEGGECVKQQIYVAELLKELEDNYMEYWLEFLEDTTIPRSILKEMREKYNNDKKEK